MTEDVAIIDYFKIISDTLKNSTFSAERIVDSFAQKSGLVGDNGYEMVHFPEDQDEYAIHSEGWVEFYPGVIELTWWDGEERTDYVSEEQYRGHLIRYLTEINCEAVLVEKLKRLIPRKPGNQ